VSKKSMPTPREFSNERSPTVDAEKALIEAYQSVCYSASASDCNHVQCRRARRYILALARAAFEEGGHVAGCTCRPEHVPPATGPDSHPSNYRAQIADPRCALPKWLTETSR